jgi:hypothetical protein
MDFGLDRRSFCGPCSCQPVYGGFVFLVCFVGGRNFGPLKNAGLQEQPFGLFWSSKTALWITQGISVLAAIFLFYLLSRTSVRDIAANFPHLFEDSDYNLVNAAGEKQNIFSLKETVTDIININPYLLAIYGILLTAMFIDKRRHLHAVYYFVGVIGIIIGFCCILPGPRSFIIICLICFRLHCSARFVTA